MRSNQNQLGKTYTIIVRQTIKQTKSTKIILMFGDNKKVTQTLTQAFSCRFV